MDWDSLSDEEIDLLVDELSKDLPDGIDEQGIDDYLNQFDSYEGPDDDDRLDWENEMREAGLDPSGYDFQHDWDTGALGGKALEDSGEEDDDGVVSDAGMKDAAPDDYGDTMRNIASALSERMY